MSDGFWSPKNGHSCDFHVKSCENSKLFSAHSDGLYELREHLRSRLDQSPKLRKLLRCLPGPQIRWNSCEFMWNHVKIYNWVLGTYNLLIRTLWAPESLAKYTTSILDVTNDSPMPPGTTNQLKFMWNHVNHVKIAIWFLGTYNRLIRSLVRVGNTFEVGSIDLRSCGRFPMPPGTHIRWNSCEIMWKYKTVFLKLTIYW